MKTYNLPVEIKFWEARNSPYATHSEWERQTTHLFCSTKTTKMLNNHLGFIGKHAFRLTRFYTFKFQWRISRCENILKETIEHQQTRHLVQNIYFLDMIKKQHVFEVAGCSHETTMKNQRSIFVWTCQHADPKWKIKGPLFTTSKKRVRTRHEKAKVHFFGISKDTHGPKLKNQRSVLLNFWHALTVPNWKTRGQFF